MVTGAKMCLDGVKGKVGMCGMEVHKTKAPRLHMSGLEETVVLLI